MPFEENDRYPEKYLSKKMSEIMGQFHNLLLPLKEPVKPIKPIDPGKFDFMLFFYLSLGWLIVPLILMFKMEYGILKYILISLFGVISFIFFISGFISLIWWIKDKINYKKEISHYTTNLKIFQKAYKKYNQNLITSQILKTEKKTIQKIQKNKKKLLKEWLDSRSKPNLVKCDINEGPIKGPSEKLFYDFLKENGFDVYNNLKIKCGNSYFYPDLILKYNGLYIDIEIDEPYEWKSGNPIHFKESIREKDRNKFFTNNGMEVIRFAEHQVYIFPEECLKEIKRFIGDLLLESSKQKYVGLLMNNKWDFMQARILRIKKFREMYVSQHLYYNYSFQKLSEIQLLYHSIVRN